jgi:RHS repeat-associated protein
VGARQRRHHLDSFALAEQHIYGSSRVGYDAVPGRAGKSACAGFVSYVIFEGWKRYEITNHLGNVLAVVTDRKRGRASSGTNIQWFVADVLSAQQYYPFGMLMPGNASTTLRRQYSLNSYDYRYGFNGKEGDDEVKGDDNQQDYGMRIYDPRVSRFLSVDPIAREYPMLTPYQFASNTPIWAIDLDGLEAYVLTQSFDSKGSFLSSTLVWDETANPLERNHLYYVHRVVDANSIIRTSRTMNADNVKYFGEKIRPFKAPESILGTTEYYAWRDNDFNIRHTLSDTWYEWQPSPPGYYMGYGDKYAKRFSEQLRPQLSSAGQEWLDRALLELQNAIEQKLEIDPSIETKNGLFKEFAFNSHVEAYENAGLFNLPIRDLILIGTTPDIKDLLSPNGFKQVRQVGLDYMQHAKEKPVSTAAKVIGFGISLYKNLSKSDDND